ncbi:MoaD/ThiS family protein [Desulfitobacterium metallireducens]|uniref:Molybdenum cofactor biosynthesis protein MoaD n=1 Tax=Desulfitobacterium metallireducens DSM 15288 TaxID=871968 RepID=W0ECP4_9FIRM|nr:MoaD/ThiS family protein [Desulfitobacterium metallireducens]AHF06974.1 molybdenum cofactor biosynthesis protein MoaD [Desulfitobacterium metallireducens DSM 15288]
MKITIKLFATLRDGRFKEQKIVVQDTYRIIDIIIQYAIPREEVSICLVNGRNVQPEQTLKEGDTFSIFPPVGGG